MLRAAVASLKAELWRYMTCYKNDCWTDIAGTADILFDKIKIFSCSVFKLNVYTCDIKYITMKWLCFNGNAMMK